MIKADGMWRMCLKKRKYLTAERAQKVASKAEKERGQKLRIYVCGLCAGWHITHSEPTK